MGFVVGPFVADSVYGHALHPNHQQPMQKTFYSPMQLPGQLRSAPATAKKSNIVMSDMEETEPPEAYVKSSNNWLMRGEVQLDGTIKKGKCKWWSREKGYGVIIPEGQEKELYCRSSEIHAWGIRRLWPDEDVEFKFGTNQQGRLVAIEVTGPEGDFVKGYLKPEEKWPELQ